MTLDVGSPYRASFRIADASGAPVNPSTATFTITKPDLSTTTAPVTLPPAVTGLLIADYIGTAPGLHRFDWATAGPVLTKTDYQSWRAFVSAISLDDARDWLNVLDTTKDEKIRGLMGAATRTAEGITGTLVQRSFTGEFVPGDMRDVIGLAHGPLPSASAAITVTSVWPGGPQWTTAAGNLVVNAEAATLRLSSFMPFWFGPWRVDYPAGRMEIPEPVELGIKEILWDMWASQRGMTADTEWPDIAEAASFEAEAAAAMSSTHYQPPARALAYLEPYRFHRFG